MIITAIPVVVIHELHGGGICREEIPRGPGGRWKICGSSNNSIAAEWVRGKTAVERSDRPDPVRAGRSSAARGPDGIDSSADQTVGYCEVRHFWIGNIVADAKQRMGRKTGHMSYRNVLQYGRPHPLKDFSELPWAIVF